MELRYPYSPPYNWYIYQHHQPQRHAETASTTSAKVDSSVSACDEALSQPLSAQPLPQPQPLSIINTWSVPIQSTPIEKPWYLLPLAAADSVLSTFFGLTMLLGDIGREIGVPQFFWGKPLKQDFMTVSVLIRYLMFQAPLGILLMLGLLNGNEFITFFCLKVWVNGTWFIFGAQVISFVTYTNDLSVMGVDDETALWKVGNSAENVLDIVIRILIYYLVRAFWKQMKRWYHFQVERVRYTESAQVPMPPPQHIGGEMGSF